MPLICLPEKSISRYVKGICHWLCNGMREKISYIRYRNIISYRPHKANGDIVYSIKSHVVCKDNQ